MSMGGLVIAVPRGALFEERLDWLDRLGVPTAEVREGVSYLFAGGAATDWGRASVLGARQGVGGSLPGVHHLFSYDSPRSGLLGPGKLTPHGTGEDSA